MEVAQRKALLSQTNKITAEISPEKVLRELANHGILHPIQIEDINKHKSAKLKTKRLLEILESCGPKAFSTFYDVLMKTGYRKLAEQLRKSTKDNKVADEGMKDQLEQGNYGDTDLSFTHPDFCVRLCRLHWTQYCCCYRTASCEGTLQYSNLSSSNRALKCYVIKFSFLHFSIFITIFQ